MRSNVCKIEKGTQDLRAILEESERVAEYNGLAGKQAMQLRLLCEEIDGMLPNVIDNFEGSLFIDYDNGICKINVSIKIPEFNAEKKQELIGISKDKKNASAKGIVGRIRNAIEDFFLSDSGVAALDASHDAFHLSTGYGEFVDYSYLWSLTQYKSAVDQDQAPNEWDELEKSVIASIADDVIVGVKGNLANIVIVKKFG